MNASTLNFSNIESMNIEELSATSSSTELASALLHLSSVLMSLGAINTIRALREADIFSHTEASIQCKSLGKSLVAELESLSTTEQAVVKIMNLRHLGSEHYWQNVTSKPYPLDEKTRRELVSLHSQIIFTTTHLPRLARLLVQMKTPVTVAQESVSDLSSTASEALPTTTKKKSSLNSWLFAGIGLLLVLWLYPYWQTLSLYAQSFSVPAVGAHSILLGGIFAYFFGGVVKGTAGIGMALLAVPTMAVLVDPRVAVALAAFPLVFTNIWQALRDKSILKTCRSYWRLSLSMTLVMAITALLTKTAPTSVITLSLGVLAIVFALINMGITIPKLSDDHDGHAQWITGTAAGLIGGVTGLVVIPLVAYMLMRQVEKNQFVSVMGFLLLISGIVLACTQWQTGVFTQQLTMYSLLLVIPGMLGIFVGEKIRKHINAATFKKVVLILIMLIGCNLVAKTVIV